MPVKTMARPASSAAAITSSSRIEPPGWMTAVAPASADGKQAVGEREERVRSYGRADRARLSPQPISLSGFLRLDRGNPRAVAPVHLACANASGRAILGIDNRIRLHMLGERSRQSGSRPVPARSARAWSRR
jgi:hypothetical protein